MAPLAPSAPPLGLLVAEVAERRRAAERDRRRRCDATSVFERLAVAARREGVRHPVAAAVARGVRMHHLATLEGLSARLGVAESLLAAAEAGEIAFAALPPPLGRVLVSLEVDVLGLADLARTGAGTRPED